MIERPASAELLEAMARTLTDTVVPDCTGAPQHAARVVANLCRILAREAHAGTDGIETSISELQAWLGSDSADLNTLVAQLDSRLATSNDDEDGTLHRILLDDARRRLDVAKPGYGDTA